MQSPKVQGGGPTPPLTSEVSSLSGGTLCVLQSWVTLSQLWDLGPTTLCALCIAPQACDPLPHVEEPAEVLQPHQPYAPLRPGTCPTHWVLELPAAGLAILLLPTSFILHFYSSAGLGHGGASWGTGIRLGKSGYGTSSAADLPLLPLGFPPLTFLLFPHPDFSYKVGHTPKPSPPMLPPLLTRYRPQRSLWCPWSHWSLC